MEDNDLSIFAGNGKSPFDIAHSLGAIEAAVCTMATDIHEAVEAQKELINRLDKDEVRLQNLETWRKEKHDRNGVIGKVALTLLLPAAVGIYQVVVYAIALSHKVELHEIKYVHTERK
jgi:hypothetical protein